MDPSALPDEAPLDPAAAVVIPPARPRTSRRTVHLRVSSTAMEFVRGWAKPLEMSIAEFTVRAIRLGVAIHGVSPDRFVDPLAYAPIPRKPEQRRRLEIHLPYDALLAAQIEEIRCALGRPAPSVLRMALLVGLQAIREIPLTNFLRVTHPDPRWRVEPRPFPAVVAQAARAGQTTASSAGTLRATQTAVGSSTGKPVVYADGSQTVARSYSEWGRR